MKKYQGNDFQAGNIPQKIFVCICGVFIFFLLSVGGRMDSACWGYIWTDYDGKNYDSDDYNPGPSSSSDSGGSGWTRQDQRQYEAEQREQQAAWDAQQARIRQGVNLNNEGVRYDKAGDFDAAISYFQQALQYTPGDQTVLNNLQNAKGKKENSVGLGFFKEGDFEKAAAQFRQALSFIPGDEVLLQNLESAEEKLQDTRERQRKEAEAKAQMEAAGTRIKSMVGRLGNELKPVSVPTATGGLGFKKAGNSAAKGAGGVQGNQKDSDAGLNSLAFKHMNPLETIIYQMVPDEHPKGGSKTAQGQMKSTEFHSREAKASSFGDTASDRARLGFDTAGVPGDNLATSPAVNVPEAKGVMIPEDKWTMIPEGKRTPALDKLEIQRKDARNERLAIEKKLADMQSKPGVNPVEIVQMREKADELTNKENWIIFTIREELGKAPEVKRSEKKEEKK